MLNIWVVLWLALALCVAAVALYRKMLASQEDDIVHVTSGENKVISKQLQVAQKLEKIDYFGKTLTIVLVVYGVALGGWFIYQGWMQSTRIGN